MKYCRECGYEINEDLNFCPSCGSRIRYDNNGKLANKKGKNIYSKIKFGRLEFSLFDLAIIICIGIVAICGLIREIVSFYYDYYQNNIALIFGILRLIFHLFLIALDVGYILKNRS